MVFEFPSIIIVICSSIYIENIYPTQASRPYTIYLVEWMVVVSFIHFGLATISVKYSVSYFVLHFVVYYCKYLFRFLYTDGLCKCVLNGKID